MAIPVHLFSGYLGAGKTTAIRAQLGGRREERIAVIVNDFGEASLDEVALDESQPFRLTNIPGGCVCCTAPEGFVDALGAVLGEAPDRLIIEPTGLARPQDLIDTIRRCAHRDALELAPVVVMVDPRQLAKDVAESDPSIGALLREQAQVADFLVANHTDLCDPDQLEGFRSFAGSLWPGPLAVHETHHGALPDTVLTWPEGEGMRAARATEQPGEPDHAHGHSTEGFRARSWHWSPAVVFSRTRLQEALERALGAEAPAPLARLKGIFRTLEGTSRLEIAGGTIHEELTAFRRDSRADAIVRSADDAALDALGSWLSESVLAESELALDASRIEIVRADGRVHGIDREQLLALPDPIPDVSTHFPNREGSAARVRALLEELGIPPVGEAVVVAGDGFASEPVPLEVLAEGVLLHTQGDEPLPDGKGGPFRLLIPEKASPLPVSCANVKGVAKVVIRDA